MGHHWSRPVYRGLTL